jgi:hypothetical protein
VKEGMMEMSKNRLKSHQILIGALTLVVIIVLLFTLLRCCHVILCIGNSYKLCFSTTYRVDELDGVHDINDENISEIRYMKNLKHFSAMYTNLNSIDFIKDFNKLESLSYCSDSNHPEYKVSSIPKLDNFDNLVYVYLHDVGVDNLGFLSDCPNLEYLTVITYDTEITDISGLANKKKLKTIHFRNTNCSDYSVLLELPELEYLEINENELPTDIKNKLLHKNIKIDEMPDRDPVNFTSS